jgi:DNA repair protein RadC
MAGHNAKADNRSTPMKDDQIISKALEILANRLTVTKEFFNSPADVKAFFTLQLGAREQEVFAVMFLTTRNGLIAFREMFFGTIDGAAVYPREIAKAALSLNAAAIIIGHNHPSGSTEPSQADQRITDRIIETMALLDIRVLDHILVGGAQTLSFSERGLL